MDWTDHPGPILIAFFADNDKTSRTEHDVKAAHRAYHMIACPYDHSGGNLTGTSTDQRHIVSSATTATTAVIF